MPTKHILINGDCRQMSLIPNESVHLIVTSPPYWQLKDYGNKNQIGFNDTYEKYINSLNLVWQECYRILQSGCRLCINIGDQFARATYYGRYKVVSIHSEIIRFCETIGLDGKHHLAKADNHAYNGRRKSNGKLSISTRRHCKN